MEYQNRQPEYRNSDNKESISIHKIIASAWNDFLENWKESSIVLVPFGVLFGLFFYSQINAIILLFQDGGFSEENISSLESSGNFGNIFNLAYYFLFAGLIRLREFKKQGNSVTLETFKIGDFFHLRDLLLIITMMLWAIIMIFGMILFIIPGIYISNLLMIALVVSTKTDSYFIDSIKDTFSLTKGHWWKIGYMNFLFYLPGMVIFLLIAVESLVSMSFTKWTAFALVATTIFGYAVILPTFVNANCELYDRLRKKQAL